MTDQNTRGSTGDTGSNLRPGSDFKVETPVEGDKFDVDLPAATETRDEADSPPDSNQRVSIRITEDDLDDQLDTLIEETGLPESVAEELYGVFQALVEEEAEAQGKEWSDEVVKGVTNVMIATAIKEEKIRDFLS